ncbi:MAG TPA: site-2 protease family protein [Acidimicrobiia bacterium]|nr:site-2 protease family protein [Acidimicrobiia bacterium]
MFTHSVSIGRYFGIEVRIDPSWLVIAFLFGWSFYAQFQHVFPDLASTTNLLLSATSVLVFFGSVVLHELSHSVMARRLGIPVEGITLFLFGGVTKTRMEASKPRDEFLVAVVGPATSIAIAGVLWALVNWGSVLIQGPLAYALGYLGWLNLGLGLFNLLPGFPLDGGRVLRSILWATGGSLPRATRRAAGVGKLIAAIMIAVGLLSVFTGNLGGLWMAAIGWFLYQAAVAVDQDVVLKALLQEVRARDLMSPNLITIPWDATIRDAVDGYFLRYDHSAFPVVGRDQPGLITLRAVRQIPNDQWELREVWTATTSLDDACTVGPDTPMDKVMEKLREQEGEQDRVLVVDGDRILGIITPRDILRWVRRSEELGLAAVDAEL